MTSKHVYLRHMAPLHNFSSGGDVFQPPIGAGANERLLHGSSGNGGNRDNASRAIRAGHHRFELGHIVVMLCDVLGIRVGIERCIRTARTAFQVVENSLIRRQIGRFTNSAIMFGITARLSRLKALMAGP